VTPLASAEPAHASTNPCKWGSKCHNYDEDHRQKFAHPEGDLRRACKFGAACYQKSMKHLQEFVHPGDRNYRIGLVVFADDQQPVFESMRQWFMYYDPDESGHLSFEEFSDALDSARRLAPARVPEDTIEAWNDAEGPKLNYLNFQHFVTWVKEFLLLEDMPVGLEAAEGNRPCRFRISTDTEDGGRCSCPSFQPSPDSPLCVCGHKPSMHRSDFAQRTASRFFSEQTNDAHWEPGQEGLVRVEDPEVIARFQEMATSSRKTHDTWTRDRGCTIHGVNGCAHSCSSKHRVPVPSDYKIVGVFRNQNQELWQKYYLLKTAVLSEFTHPQEQHNSMTKYVPPLQKQAVATGAPHFEGENLDADYNEWYLYHGTSWPKCKGICSSNFRLALAGTGNTWKEAGKTVGTPLYGYGIYFAERITKADEYSETLPQDDPLVASLDADGDQELYCVLVCRVLGGRTRVVTTNEFEIDKLKADVFEGPYKSVFGDRETILGKPYREVVVYDKDQCFPEFVIVYSRVYG